jgi:diguanylate cyclase (GGDEF)-like protein
MTPPDVAGLVSFIGTATQLGGAVLLAAFFLLLSGHARRRPYFRAWTLAWMWISLALAAVFALYLNGWLADGLPARALWALYQFAKLLFLASLLAGALAYTRGTRPGTVMRVAAPASALYALASAAVAGGLNQVVQLQAPLAAVVLAACAALLLRLPRSRATLGSRATASVFAALAALWVLYAVAFTGWTDPARGGIAALGFVTRHNSYMDLLLQVLLGYGMVVVLMEDAKRETDAAHAELAVAHDALKRLALHDSLTGALNRRAWTEGVGLDGVRASRGAAVMLDLDNLKRVNDLYGHAAGDELLRRTAEVLRAAVRPADRLYRWGGDEFLLLLPGARAADARRRVDEVIAAANAALPAGDAGQLALEASAGASDYAGGEGLDAAIRRADAAMYDEKSRRRRPRAPTEVSAD